MRQSVGIAAVAVVAVVGLWAWTVAQGGANARKAKVPQAINTYELTVAAPALPTQQYDAH